MSTDTQSLTVAIPTFGRGVVLLETIGNVLSYLEEDMELIVVDQNPTHEASVERQLRDWHEQGRVRWIRKDRPSLTGSRNLALRMSRAPIVLFVDDDVVLSPTLLRQHLDRDRAGDYAAVSGTIYEWQHGPAMPSFDDPRAKDAPQPLPPQYGPGYSGPIDWFIGCHVSLRKRDAIAVGGYDECFIGPAFGEDMDMARRLVAAGRRILFDPTIELLHRRSPSGGCRIPGTRTWSGWTKSANHFLYMFRHGRTLTERLDFFVRGLRAGPLLRENVLRPWRWPRTWWDVIPALRYGWTHHGRVRSEFAQTESGSRA